MNKHDPIPAGLTRRQTLLAMLGAAGLSACGGGGGWRGQPCRVYPRNYHQGIQAMTEEMQHRRRPRR